MKIISIDIDGVLNFYPKPLIKFINDKYSLKFKNKEDIRRFFSNLEYEKLKNNYRNSEYKSKMEFNTNLGAKLKEFAKNNRIKIIILTQRLIENHSMLSSTKKWLKHNNFFFPIYKKKDWVENKKKHTNHFIHIDDEEYWYKIFILNKLNCIKFDYNITTPSLLISNLENLYEKFIIK